MVCSRCEKEYEGAPWMIFDGRNLEAYCPDCALEVVQDRMTEHELRVRKVQEN